MAEAPTKPNQRWFCFTGEYHEAIANVAHGNGAVLYHDDSLYEGEIRFNRRNGFGTLTFPDLKKEYDGVGSARFSGSWKDDYFEGCGNSYVDGFGLELVGSWKRGEIVVGIERDLKTKTIVYKGGYRNGKRCGKASFEGLRDGGVIIGSFSEGKMHGCCAYAYPYSGSKMSKNDCEDVIDFWDDEAPALLGIYKDGRLLKNTWTYYSKGVTKEMLKKYIETTPTRSVIRDGVFEDSRKDPRELERVEFIEDDEEKLVSKVDVVFMKNSKVVDFLALVTGKLTRYDSKNPSKRWFPKQRITIIDDLSDEEDDGGNDDEEDGVKAKLGGYFIEYEEKLENSLGCEATIARKDDEKDIANVKRRMIWNPFFGKCLALVPTCSIKRGDEIILLVDYIAGYRLNPKRFRSMVSTKEKDLGY